MEAMTQLLQQFLESLFDIFQGVFGENAMFTEFLAQAREMLNNLSFGA